jgi:hypothetical protein
MGAATRSGSEAPTVATHAGQGLVSRQSRPQANGMMATKLD